MAISTTPPPVLIVNAQRTSGFCIASLILGIVSLLGGAVTIIIPILAIVFGHLGRKKCKLEPQTTNGSGMGLAGLIMGYVSVVLAVCWCMLVFVFFAATVHNVQVSAKNPNSGSIASAQRTQSQDGYLLVTSALQVMMETGAMEVEAKIASDGTVLSDPLKQYVKSVVPGTQVVGGKIFANKPTTIQSPAGTQRYDEYGSRMR